MDQRRNFQRKHSALVSWKAGLAGQVTVGPPPEQSSMLVETIDHSSQTHWREASCRCPATTPARRGEALFLRRKRKIPDLRCRHVVAADGCECCLEGFLPCCDHRLRRTVRYSLIRRGDLYCSRHSSKGFVSSHQGRLGRITRGHRGHTAQTIAEEVVDIPNRD